MQITKPDFQIFFRGKKYYKTTAIIIFLGVVFILPISAFAQSISLISDSLTYGIGDNIPVALSLNTEGNSVNAIKAVISVPVEFFDILNIKTGSSFLSLWPERPQAHKDGKITFLGGVPKGFSGNDGNVITFTLKAKKLGVSSIFVDKATVLLNDGLGTKLSGVELIPLTILISEYPPDKSEDAPIMIDDTPPEPFIPIISKDDSVADGKYFVSFSTTDKGSGVDYYEVREKYVLFPYFGVWFFTNWQKAETPYILNLQHWWSKVYVRAYDFAGNYRQEVAFKPISEEANVVLYSAFHYVLFALVMIILIYIASRVYIKLKYRK